MEETARSLDLPVPAVRTAVGDYLEFRPEIDAELDARRSAARRSAAAFRSVSSSWGEAPPATTT